MYHAFKLQGKIMRGEVEDQRVVDCIQKQLFQEYARLNAEKKKKERDRSLTSQLQDYSNLELRNNVSNRQFIKNQSVNSLISKSHSHT